MRFLFFIGISLFCGEVMAQAASETPTQRVEYFDADHQKIASENGATERVETTYRDSVAGAVRTYYLPSGKLRSYVPYAHLGRRVRQGTSSHYYESGQLRLQETHVAGKWQGDLLTYYPDGTLKRRDHHVPGQPVAGECFGPDGKPVQYFAYEKMPVYPEGAGDRAAVARAVQMNTRYPTYALKQRVYGVVKIKFVVDKNGKVQNVRPDEKLDTSSVAANLKDAYQSLQQAAIDAVRGLKTFTPGQQDGEPVAVSFTVPVTFRIK